MAGTSPARTRVHLRPQNPFDLIRLLARSQSDPRKAVGELVQNSLDAGAGRIEIDWFTHEGRRALRIWDDGRGVFPELEREEALRTIARTIGHSHKRELTPSERREQMVLGQYGIGLIGFWSVGEVLEIKSRVGGGKPWVLRLREDRATGEVFPSRSRCVGDEDTFTEVTVSRVHETVAGRVRPPRLQAYLASELRGQLLERDAVVRIRDRVARGRARKHFVVEPQPYLGVPLDEWRELEVPGFETARVELYLVSPDEDRRGVVALSCGGAVVLDDLGLIDGDDAPRAPWTSGRLEGVIDFPELHVSPGTRRGFSHDEPVAAFLDALAGLEREIAARLEREARQRAEAHQEEVARKIRSAFRGVVRRLGDYDFFGVRGPGGSRESSAPGAVHGHGGPASPGGAAPGGELIEREDPPEAAVDDEPAARPEPEDLLFPPGPLERLEVRPKRLRLPPLATRSLLARALDADGRPCAGEVELAWHLHGAGELEPDGARARYTAPEPGADEPGLLRVAAKQGERLVEVEVPIQLAPASGADARLQGIPDPHPVSAPGESWRSRLRVDRWEYNDAHRDYLTVASDPPRRLRYLVHLLAKELVLRNFGNPADTQVLERMVEILTHLEPGRGR